MRRHHAFANFWDVARRYGSCDNSELEGYLVLRRDQSRTNRTVSRRCPARRDVCLVRAAARRATRSKEPVGYCWSSLRFAMEAEQKFDRRGEGLLLEFHSADCI